VDRSFEYRRSQRGIQLQLQALRDYSVVEDLPRIRQPVLVLHGTEDQVIPERNALLFVSGLNAVKLVRLRGLGHMFWFEDPVATLNVLRTFLSAPAPAL